MLRRYFTMGVHALAASVLICGCQSSRSLGNNETELDSRALALQEQIGQPREVPDRPALTESEPQPPPKAEKPNSVTPEDLAGNTTRQKAADFLSRYRSRSGTEQTEADSPQQHMALRPATDKDEPIQLAGSEDSAGDEETMQLDYFSPPPREPRELAQSGDPQDEAPLPRLEPLDEDAESGEGPSSDEGAPDDVPQADAPGINDDPAIGDRMPIDFPTVVRLAGAENWGVRLAYERIAEEQANLDLAELLWVPSINLGLTYNKHDGQIQGTEGEIVDISRNSLFIGGGAGIQNAPLTGGAGGPRLFVDLSLADAFFQPLAQRQLLNAARFQHATAFNDTLLEASVAYYELARAQAGVVVTRDNLDDAVRLEQLTRQFVAAGRGSEAEVSRVRAEVERRRRDVVDAELAVQIVSAELARILQLDPTKLPPRTPLYAADDQLTPLGLISEMPLGDLIGQAHRSRPELADRLAQIEANCELTRLEEVRPFIPNLYVGASGGGFGGGTGGGISDFSNRGDFDLAAVWRLDNLGFGNHAAADNRRSQYRQAILDYHRMRDRVSTEVMQSYHSVEAAERQIELARANVEAATDSLDRNLQRIRGLEGLPIEALQTITAVSEARQAYVDAVIDYNQSQLELLRAIGQVPE